MSEKREYIQCEPSFEESLMSPLVSKHPTEVADIIVEESKAKKLDNNKLNT